MSLAINATMIEPRLEQPSAIFVSAKCAPVSCFIALSGRKTAHTPFSRGQAFPESALVRAAIQGRTPEKARAAHQAAPANMIFATVCGGFATDSGMRVRKYLSFGATRCISSGLCLQADCWAGPQAATAESRCSAAFSFSAVASASARRSLFSSTTSSGAFAMNCSFANLASIF